MTAQLSTALNALGTMEGWCTLEKAHALCRSVLETKPQVCVEIGVFGGRSLAAIGLALKEQGSGLVYGIDPWFLDYALEGEVGVGNTDWWKKLDLAAIHAGAMRDLHQCNIWRHVRIVALPSHAVANALSTIDWLHIDGNHSRLAASRDVALYLPKLRSGGHLWMDDTDWSTVGPAIEVIREHCEEKPDWTTGACKLFAKK